MRGVVAKYKEDISWISEFQNLNLDIYNKNESDPLFDYNFPNIGRESETYIRYIINNYYNFKLNEKIIFLQGDPFDHIPISFFDECLKINSHLPIPITKRWSYCHYSNVFICYDNGIYNKFNTPQDPMMTWNLTVEAAKYLNIPKFNYVIEHFGAQWIVPVKYIWNKSYEWWEKAHSLHYLNNDIGVAAPYIYERLWEKIWYHSDIED